MVYWVLQDGFSEESFGMLVTALEQLGVPHSVHKVIPFVGEITDVERLRTLPDGTRFVVMGSYSLAHWARDHGLVPGAFLANLDFETQLAHWGERMLNHAAVVCRFDAIPERVRPFFLRPIADTKAFAGQVIDWPDYVAWRDRVLALAPDELANETLHELRPWTRVMVCPKVTIEAETRCWIVAGRVVTWSGYKIGTRVRYSPPSAVDPRVVAFAQACADVWSPNEAYVMDIAETADGLRIIEVNNLNSAGFYKADMTQLVAAIEAHVGA